MSRVKPDARAQAQASASSLSLKPHPQTPPLNLTLKPHPQVDASSLSRNLILLSEGSITSTVTLGDIDGDGTLDVVVGVTAKDGSGEVWALNAESGLTLPNFPVGLMNR